jgi:drug/metabolite transporter (DMT)-like permease
MKVDLFVILIVLICAILGATGQIMLKIASKKFTFEPLKWVTNMPLLIGILLYGLTSILFVWSLKFGEVSIIYPIFATSYIWVSLFAYIYLGEVFNFSKLGGVFLIVLGIFFLTR